jgi:arsenical pump membrane protein
MSFSVNYTDPVDDHVLSTWSPAVLALLVPAVVSPLPVWIPACASALVLLEVVAVRRRSELQFWMVP